MTITVQTAATTHVGAYCRVSIGSEMEEAARPFVPLSEPNTEEKRQVGEFLRLSLDLYVGNERARRRNKGMVGVVGRSESLWCSTGYCVDQGVFCSFLVSTWSGQSMD